MNDVVFCSIFTSLPILTYTDKPILQEKQISGAQAYPPTHVHKPSNTQVKTGHKSNFAAIRIGALSILYISVSK